MSVKNIDLIIRAFETIARHINSEDVKKFIANASYCIIHKARPIEYNGRKGVLIWDYLVWNDLTFLDEDGNVTRFIDGLSDKRMEEEFDYYYSRYRI